MRRAAAEQGFTLIEFLLGGLVLAIAVTAILGAYIGQVTLNEHARNLSLAVQDANRVIEQMRENTASCTQDPRESIPCPGTEPFPVGFAPATSWNNWMNTAGGGKSIGVPNNNDATALINVTCEDSAGTQTAPADTNPVRVTVSVCWRHRGRTIGECSFDGVNLAGNDAGQVYPGTDTPRVVDSPAMLTTLMTCRG